MTGNVSPIRGQEAPQDPTPLVIAGANSYFQYLVGAQTFHDPLTTRLIHGYEDVEDHETDIIFKAEHLVVHGLKEAIRSAFLPGIRGGLGPEENRFAEHLPHLTSVVEYTYTAYADRVNSLNPALMWLRPAPILDRIVFRYLCHSRRGKLTTKNLLPGISVHPNLRERTIDFSGGLQNAVSQQKN